MTESRYDFETLTASYARAVLAKDANALAALYSPNVRVFDTWGRWSYDSLAGWRVNLDEWLGSLGDESVHVSFGGVRATIGGDLGFLSALVTYVAVDGADKPLREMQNRLSWVLARKDVGWLIVHEHTSAPIGFEDMKAILRGD